jgi:hypothetical protein
MLAFDLIKYCVWGYDITTAYKNSEVIIR